MGDDMNYRERYKYDRRVQELLDMVGYDVGEPKIKLKIHLKAKAIEAGYTRDTLAEKVGISPESLSRIFSEKNNDISGSTMIKIARCLGMAVEDIWEALD